jgi:Ca2+-binding EF-hand superfamily protein
MMSSITAASTALSSDSLTRLFQQADANGDNTLSQDELLNALSGSQGSTGTSDSVASLFKEMDRDGDGSLSQNEFSSFAQMFAADSGKALLVAQEETAEATDDADAASQNAAVNSDVFDSLDRDGDGVISESEFAAALQSKVDGETLSEDELNALFAAIDANGDASISAEELSSAMGEAMGAPPPPTELSEDETSDAAASTESAASSASGAGGASENYDPLDTNEDGVVSAAEQAAGEMDSFGLLNGTTLGALMQFNEVSQAA